MSRHPAGPGAREGWSALPVPIALGLAIGTLVQLLGFVLVTVIVLGSTGPGQHLSGGRVLGTCLVGAGSLTLACALAARTCSRRGGVRGVRGVRQVDGRLLHRSALGAGLGLGGVVLLIGLAPVLRWTTLPIYLAAVVAGSVLGARTAR
jgi:hypothetical protein